MVTWSNLKSDLKAATSITLVYMCILHLTAILVASGAMTTSKWPQGSNLTLYLKLATLITLESMWIFHNSLLVASEAMAASKQPQWPQGSNLTSYLESATLITLVSMCMLPLTPFLMAYEAMAASEWSRRSYLASESNSGTLNTYFPMSVWHLYASMA